MNSLDVHPHAVRDWAKFAVGLLSAILGLAGTWLMSRRYARQFGRALLYSLVWPGFVLARKGERIARFLEERVKDNRDLPERITDMVLGLLLLFWSFFLQLSLPFFDLKH